MNTSFPLMVNISLNRRHLFSHFLIAGIIVRCVRACEHTHARTRAHTQVQEHPLGKTNSAVTPVCPQRTPGDGLKEEHLGNGLQRHKSERLKWDDTPSLTPPQNLW